jgi:hypothetical protein
VWTCVNCYVFAGALDLDVGVSDRQSFSFPQGYSSDALDLGPRTGLGGKERRQQPRRLLRDGSPAHDGLQEVVGGSSSGRPWPLMSAYLMSLMIVFLSC